MIEPGQFTLQNIRKAVRNPGAVRELLERSARQRSLQINGAVHDLRWDPVDVMAEDWDNLLLLDACRYDAFESRNTINGRLESRISKGSSSGEFLKTNFSGRSYYDTVYVTANPWVHLVQDAFHTIVDLVHDECWDSENKTVPPEMVVARAKQAFEEYSHKRLIVHFMQPHYPFLGSTGDLIDFDTGISRVDPNDYGGQVWFHLPNKGREKVELVERAYLENLDLALRYAAELVDALPGKTVISADHGNLIADRTTPIPVRGYGHPAGVHVPELVRVPWHVIESEHRRDVVADDPVYWDQPLNEEVNQRLHDLGYA